MVCQRDLSVVSVGQQFGKIFSVKGGENYVQGFFPIPVFIKQPFPDILTYKTYYVLR